MLSKGAVCSWRPAPGAGWLNFSCVERQEANARESRGWRSGYLGIQGRRPVSPRSRRARPSSLRSAAAEGSPACSAALPLWLPAPSPARSRRASSLLLFPSVTCRSHPPLRISQHLAALSVWAGWRTRVTSAPSSPLSSPPLFREPGARLGERRALRWDAVAPSSIGLPSSQPDHLGKSFVLNSFSS